MQHKPVHFKAMKCHGFGCQKVAREDSLINYKAVCQWQEWAYRTNGKWSILVQTEVWISVKLCSTGVNKYSVHISKRQYTWCEKLPTSGWNKQVEMVIKNKIIKHLVDVIGTSSAASTKAENLLSAVLLWKCRQKMVTENEWPTISQFFKKPVARSLTRGCSRGCSYEWNMK